MTQSFRAGLLVFGVLVLATLAIWLVLGSHDRDPALTGPDGVARGRGPSDDGVDPIRLAGSGTDDRPEPGTRPPASPGGSDGSIVGLRTPEGVDFSDPKQVTDRMAQLVADRPVPWADVARLAAVFDGTLPDEVREALLGALAQGDRTGALRVFVVTRDGTLVRDLFHLLDTTDLTPGAKGALYQALGVMPGANDAEVVRGLEARLTGNGRADLQALKAIGQRGGRDGARALVDYLLRAEQPENLPNYGYLGLNLRDDPAAVEVVTQGIAEATSPATLSALVKLSAQTGADGMVDSLVALDHADQSQQVRTEVLEALARIGTDKSLAYLMSVAERPGSYGEHALRNLGRMQSATPEARQRLVAALEDGGRLSRSPEAKRAALQALGNLREQKAMPAMVEALDDGDEAVRHTAVYGLGTIGEPARGHVDRLLDVFGNADAKMQRQVAVALGGIGGDASRRALEQMLVNEQLEPTVRRTARMALQRLKMDEAEEGRTQPPDPAGSSLGGRKR